MIKPFVPLTICFCFFPGYDGPLQFALSGPDGDRAHPETVKVIPDAPQHVSYSVSNDAFAPSMDQLGWSLLLFIALMVVLTEIPMSVLC
jgi:hypothetical protein